MTSVKPKLTISSTAGVIGRRPTRALARPAALPA